MHMELGKYYHVFNKSIDGNTLFKEDKDYLHFIDLIRKYVVPWAEVYAYCLIPNHFHWLIKIKHLEKLKKLFSIRTLNHIKKGQTFS